MLNSFFYFGILIVSTSTFWITAVQPFSESRHDEVQTTTTINEYCQWESFNVTCSYNEFIIVTSARYGRMRVGRCVGVDYYVGCSVDALPQLQQRCSGRRSCAVDIADRSLFGVQPCRKDLIPYLEANYRCVSVLGLTPGKLTGVGVNPPPSSSSSSSSSTSSSSRISSPACLSDPIKISDKSGYLSVGVTRDTKLGSSSCPWLIEGGQGQHVVVSVVDFSSRTRAPSGSASQRSSGSGGSLGRGSGEAKGTTWDGSGALPPQSLPLRDKKDHDLCLSVAAVSEKWPPIDSSKTVLGRGEAESQKIVANKEREAKTPEKGESLKVPDVSHAKGGVTLRQCHHDSEPVLLTTGNQTTTFTTSGNQLYVEILNIDNTTSETPIYLYFEVVGCADMITSPNSWLQRFGDQLIVTCNDTNERWYIVCDGREWVGESGNCSIPPVILDPQAEENEFKHVKRFPFGLLLAVAVGVAIGIAIGFALLLLVCVCRKSWMREQSKYADTDDEPCRIQYGTDVEDNDDNDDYVTGGKKRPIPIVETTPCSAYLPVLFAPPPEVLTTSRDSTRCDYELFERATRTLDPIPGPSGRHRARACHTVTSQVASGNISAPRDSLTSHLNSPLPYDQSEAVELLSPVNGGGLCGTRCTDGLVWCRRSTGGMEARSGRSGKGCSYTTASAMKMPEMGRCSSLKLRLSPNEDRDVSCTCLTTSAAKDALSQLHQQLRRQQQQQQQQQKQLSIKNKFHKGNKDTPTEVLFSEELLCQALRGRAGEPSSVSGTVCCQTLPRRTEKRTCTGCDRQDSGIENEED